ncbi:MAG TPA: hypothetical protein DCE42_30795, partial [Myxococcales bacterium]|nr:hypothetical protein [Myxococcales bacterium]
MKKQRMLLSVLTSVLCCVCLSSAAFAETKAKAPTSKPVTKKAKKAKPAVRTTITVNSPKKRKPAIRTTITVNPPSKRKPA